MLGIFYIFVCFFTGYAICSIAFPKLRFLTTTSYHGEHINVSSYFIILPAWYLTGTLLVTWTTYFLAYLNGHHATPLKLANMITIPLFFIVSLLVLIWNRKNKINTNQDTFFLVGETKSRNRTVIVGEIIFLLLVALLVSVLMWITFFVKGNQLYVGITVFGDFSPHLGMVRSFSVGNNFPTQYSHFAGEDIRYHFMFQFLVGNLEYLGLRIDYAFNIPSILSLISTFMLLYTLAIKITGKRAAGYLACLFCTFRSSESLFTFLSEIPKGVNIWDALMTNMEYIGYTPNEDWGLWNLNVYCNQRHLAFSVSVMMLVVILFLPRFYAMFVQLQKNQVVVTSQSINNQGIESISLKLKDKTPADLFHRWYKNFYLLFLDKEGWKVKDPKTAVACGMLLGSIAFWNGAALIAALSVLFVMAILSKHRLEFLIMAIITLILSFGQAKLFILGEAVSPKFFFGFIAENKTWFGVASYLKKLLGVLPFVLFAYFLMEKSIKKCLILVFSAPLILAFTLSLTVDITVNHKYIMIAVIFLGICAADFLVQVYEKRNLWTRIGCFLIALTLIGTGVYDFNTLLRKNKMSTAIVLDLDNSLTNWIINNSNSKDIFLTSNYALNQVVLGGGMLYQGWQYFAWSAGYDTYGRDEQVKRMYESDTPESLMELVKKNQIRFIIVDRDNRNSVAYEVNEENIKNTYECRYRDGEGDGMISIYDTKLPFELELQ